MYIIIIPETMLPQNIHCSLLMYTRHDARSQESRNKGNVAPALKTWRDCYVKKLTHEGNKNPSFSTTVVSRA